MKPWQAILGAGTLAALFIFQGTKKSARLSKDLWRLRFEVDDDRRAQIVLGVLEEYGRSTELEDFDGKNLSVRWLPDAWYVEGQTGPVDQVFRTLDRAEGVKFISSTRGK